MWLLYLIEEHQLSDGIHTLQVRARDEDEAVKISERVEFFVLFSPYNSATLSQSYHVVSSGRKASINVRIDGSVAIFKEILMR